MREITYAQAIGEAIREEMERDATVFVMGEDVQISPFGSTAGVVEKFGVARVRSTPISEAGFVGAGVGAALAGARPIVDGMMASFFWVAMDQLVNQAAKIHYMSGGQATLPLTICALYGVLGSAAAQHSETCYASFLSVPGLKMAFPTTPYSMKGMLKSAIRDNNPVLVFEHPRLMGKKGPVPEDEYLVPLGKAAIVREGRDVSIVAIGWMVDLALQAAKRLEGEDVSAEVIDVRCLAPLDRETILASVRKTGRLVVVDEGHKTGSAAGEIAAIAAEEAFSSLRAPIRRVASLDVPMPFAPAMESFVIPSVEKIYVAVKTMMTSPATAGVA